MERVIFLIFLCAASEGDIGKHIFVNQDLPWYGALTYCRLHHTDLSYISRQSDQDKLAAADQSKTGWMGLHRDPYNKTAWKWSAGGYITYTNWDDQQPSQSLQENTVFFSTNGKWHDAAETSTIGFYCISVSVVADAKTWEEAMRHCNSSQTKLISLHSENDRLTAQKVIQKADITERVWIGLRFLVDRWLWVNGEPLDYQAWPQGGDQDHQCPVWRRCGALTKWGLWENRDCSERLNFICS